MNHTAYPLSWPDNVPRTPSRKNARFSAQSRAGRRGELTIAEAVQRVVHEVSLIKGGCLVISSNVPPGTRTGLPLSVAKNPEDPGVAVYFERNGLQLCFPCDRWARVADNLAAIAAHLDALRGMERWGVGETHQAYVGYRLLALPAPGSDWKAILGPQKTIADVEASYTELAKKMHPDQGGSHEDMVRLNTARTAARKALSR